MRMKRLLFFLFAVATLASCTSEPKPKQDTTPPVKTPPRVKAPAFNADSAYNYVKAQVDFGPRVPNSPAHDKCAEYIQQKLKAAGLTVKVQEGPSTTFDGKQIRLKNIIGSYKPERRDRILLLAHWDTRPFADQDSVNKDKPIDGADDGASGVAMLLEIARALQQQDPNIGVDLFFSDAEDYGQLEDTPRDQEKENTWCLGTQYWANHLEQGYTARWAILFDMVGGKDATFPREGTSIAYAPWLVDKIWNRAAEMGYTASFINDQTGQTTDDHVYVNGVAQIPCIDIVGFDVPRGTYRYWHHCHSDNMDIIDKNTLKTVGHVVLDVLYNETPPEAK